MEQLSAAEQAYFSSKGEDTAGLEAESGLGESQTGESSNGGSYAPSTQTGLSGAPEGPEQAGEGGDGDEVVIVGKDGRPRGSNSGRFVPHQALHAERQKRKATESELQTMREQMARADERLSVLNQLIGADGGQSGQPGQHNAPQQEIDPNADPLGALQQAYAKIKALESRVNETATQQQERENSRAMMSAYQQDAARFVQEKPEFADAYSYLIEGMHRELEAMGMTDPDERRSYIADRERGIVQSAFKGRRSPSQMVYNLAVARGFSPSAADPKQNGANRIEQLAKGQRVAGLSLSSAGGTSGEGLTAAALASMSDEEFSTVAAKLGKSGLRRLMGG